MFERRFKSLKEIHSPDLWPDIEGREPRPPRREVPWGRLGTVALALVVAAAGFAFAYRAFFGEEPGPAAALDTSIAFVVREHPAAIYSMNPDGTNVRKLVEGRDPAWSPDGTRLAFRRGRTDEPGGLMNRIYLAGADGSNVRTIYEGNGGEPGGAGAPAWSPDGSQIAFAEIDGLRVMEADGSGARLVVPNEEIHDCYATEPSWSPYGTWISFAARCSGGDLGIFVVRPDGSDLKQLTGKVVVDGSGLSDTPPYLDSYPAWSPDGSRIAFVRRLDEPPLAPASIYVMEADGSDATKVSDAPHEGFYEYAPTWSPDSSRIAFTDAVDGRIYLVNADGTGLRPITEPGLDACCPAWQPDSSMKPPPLEPVVQVDARIAASIPVGSFPRAITAGFGAVWVTLPEEDGSGGLLKRIDPVTNEVVAEIALEEAGEIASGSGSVWVAATTNSVGPQGETSNFRGVVYRIDPATDQIVDEIPFEGGFVYDIAADDSGVWLAQATGNRTGAVLRIDPGTSQVVATIPVDDVPYSLVTGEGFVWALLGPRGLVKIDPSTDEVVATIDANPMPFEMAVGDGAVWVQSWLSAFDPSINTGSEDRLVIIRIDADTNEIAPPIDYSEGFYPVTVTHGGVWFMGGHLGRGPDQVVARLNTTSLEVDASVSLPPEDHESRNFLAFEEATGSIWIANYRDAVTRVDLLPPG